MTTLLRSFLASFGWHAGVAFWYLTWYLFLPVATVALLVAAVRHAGRALRRRAGGSR